MQHRSLLVAFLAIGLIPALGGLSSSQTHQTPGPAFRATSAARTAQATLPATEPTPLPGHGLAQHPFLYCGEWDTRKPVQTMYIVRNGKVAWSYSIHCTGRRRVSERCLGDT